MSKTSSSNETKNIACWIALSTLKDKWNIKYRLFNCITLELTGSRGSFKMQAHANRGEGRVNANLSILSASFLIEHLVHKLCAIITRFFVSFIKTTALLKIYVQ